MKMLYIKHRSGKVMNNFAISAILAAKELNIDFTIANNMSMAEKGHFEKICEKYGIKMVHIDFDRNPLSPKNLKARRQLLDLMKKEKYDIMHCNTPSGGMIGRICARKMNTSKVIYMAHGFHFWKGAPIKNWLFYYPVERFLAHYTDRLITINSEDYKRAQGFHYKKGGRAVYVPGVGIDINRYQPNLEIKKRKRAEIGIHEQDIMLLSVGEINSNKNHRVVIQALAKLNRKELRYVICGVGSLTDELKKYAEDLGVSDQVQFEGFRTDISDYYQAADIFIISSFREGLSVSLMEAMANNIPCIASKIRGNVDLLPDSQLTFEPHNADELSQAISNATDVDIVKEEIDKNNARLELFSMKNATLAMKNVYIEIMSEIKKEREQTRK